MARLILSGLMVAFSCAITSGCFTGSGEGWVSGSLNVTQCVDGEPYQGAIKLDVDFFSGEPLFDSTRSEVERRDRVTIRLQETGSLIEHTNGLLLELFDMRRLAQQMIARQPVAISDEGPCAANCASLDPLIKGQVYFFSACPANRQPLVLSARPVASIDSALARAETCPPLREQSPTICPTLNEAEQQTLDRLCTESSFDDPSAAQTIRSILGDSGCFYFCQLGSVTSKSTLAEASEYKLDFGDEISALFVANLLDKRAFELNVCPAASGQITSRFRFKLRRGPAAQQFP